MIWFTLALFVISFLLTALLTPKPEFEHARPSQLNDVDFPRATEDAPIPLILGKVRMKAPNTIWYGNFTAVAIVEKVKTGLFSSKYIVVGHRYFMTIDLALGMGPEIVCTEIFIDDKSIWTGTTNSTASTAFNISDSGFFGGHKSGGGWITSNTFYSGAIDLVNQPVDSVVEGLVGAGNVPAYLGVSHIVMDGEIGEAAQIRKMAFVLQSYTNDLGGIPDSGLVGEDMNPAEAIYQIFSSNWRGMGVDVSDIDLVKLRALGNTLHAEGNGVSIQVTAETNGAKVIQEILRQIDGIAFQDPDTGQIVFKLIRDDYDITTLPLYDEDDIIKVVNFSRTGWDEVVAQVKISFPQRDQDSNVVAISQDMATAGMIGRLKSSTMSMPFCFDSTLANQIASRERAQLSIPLFRMTIELNRNANTLRPGTVFKMNWPEYGFTDLVMRVQEFDFGSLLDGRIVIKCLQDTFAVSSVVFSDPAGSGWVAPVMQPQPIITKALLEMPIFFVNKLEYPTADGFASVIPLALPPSTESSAFDLVVGIATGDANLDTREPQYADYAGTATVATEYSILEGLATGVDTVTNLHIENVSGDAFLQAASLADMQTGEHGIVYIDGEWIGFTGILDNGDDTFDLTNVYRGLLGTVPKTHIVGTRVWQITPSHFGTGVLDDLTESGTAYWKVLDRVGPVSKGVETVSENSDVMASLADRPIRPRLATLAGQRADLEVFQDADLSLSWVPSNRGELTLPIETDPAETPDQTENYDVEVWVGGVFQASLSTTGATSPWTIPFSTTSLPNNDNCEIRVYAIRTGTDLRRSAGYAILPFRILSVRTLLSGDMQSGTDKFLLSGDMTDGDDNLLLSGDEA